MAYDVFISYASEDKSVADAVCTLLESRSVDCWIAPRNVLPGIAYGEAIIDAIRGYRVMILIFSSKSNTSPHVPKEIERAVSGRVVPLAFAVGTCMRRFQGPATARSAAAALFRREYQSYYSETKPGSLSSRSKPD